MRIEVKEVGIILDTEIDYTRLYNKLTALEIDEPLHLVTSTGMSIEIIEGPPLVRMSYIRYLVRLLSIGEENKIFVELCTDDYFSGKTLHMISKALNKSSSTLGDTLTALEELYLRSTAQNKLITSRGHLVLPNLNLIKIDFSNANELQSPSWLPVIHMIASCYNYWNQCLDYSGLLLVTGDELPIKIDSVDNLEETLKNYESTVYTLMYFDKGVLSNAFSGIDNFTNLIKIIKEERLWKH